MLRRIGRYALLVNALTACVGLWSADAQAWHTDKRRLTDGTAYTLGKKVWKVGLWTIDYGLHDRVDVSTYWMPWFVRVANIGGKYEYRVNERLSLGTGLHAFRLDVQKLKTDAAPLVITSVPWQLTGSYRLDQGITLSLQSIYTYMHVSGTFDEGSLEGAAAVSNLQLVTTLEKRLSQVTALLLRFRYLAHQWQPSASVTYVLHPDDYTTVKVVGAAGIDALDVKNAWSIVPGAAFSWKSAELRVGLGYGNLNIGGVNFVVQKKTIVPELDLAWRW